MSEERLKNEKPIELISMPKKGDVIHLEQITEKTWVINGVTMTTVYKMDEHNCILLDSGHYRDCMEIDRLLEESGLTVRAVLSTHAHHDHFGNCRYFAKKFGLPVILPLGEAWACSSAETYCLYLGLRSSFRARSGSLAVCIGPVDQTIAFDQPTITVAGETFDVLHTRGHTYDNVSFRTPDGVLVVGDLLSTGDALKKLRAPYTTVISQDIASKQRIAREPCTACVMAHRGWARPEELPGLAEANIAVYESMIDTVRQLIHDPMGIDDIIPLFCKARNIYGPTALHGMEMRHVVGAILGYLLDRHEIRSDTERGLTHFIPCDPDDPAIANDGLFEGKEMRGRE